jgi:redox-sensitive bicupin YhaK (pirin superfamily)
MRPGPGSPFEHSEMFAEAAAGLSLSLVVPWLNLPRFANMSE